MAKEKSGDKTNPWPKEQIKGENQSLKKLKRWKRLGTNLKLLEGDSLGGAGYAHESLDYVMLRSCHFNPIRRFFR